MIRTLDKSPKRIEEPHKSDGGPSGKIFDIALYNLVLTARKRFVKMVRSVVLEKGQCLGDFLTFEAAIPRLSE